ncbi:MAG: hypothetical protein ACXWID_19565 [Pyrinomonadaceae bacterium]
MKKELRETKRNDELRPEYDLSKLKGGVRGKYYRQAIAGKNQTLSEIAACNRRRQRSEVRNLKKHKK